MLYTIEYLSIGVKLFFFVFLAVVLVFVRLHYVHKLDMETNGLYKAAIAEYHLKTFNLANRYLAASGKYNDTSHLQCRIAELT